MYINQCKTIHNIHCNPGKTWNNYSENKTVKISVGYNQTLKLSSVS